MSANKSIAVILSGCGHKDGAEITESVSTLIALGLAGASYKVFAPDIDFSVTDPVSSVPTGESRNVMTESARISRGQIRPLSELKMDEFDGLALPGGYGAALNLCDWAKNGAACAVNVDVEKTLNGFYRAQKPIAAICISPALVARVLGAHGITVTIGNDPDTAGEIEKTGAHHQNCDVTDFVSDREHRIITTPAYMYDDARPDQVFTGIKKAIAEFVEMA